MVERIKAIRGMNDILPQESQKFRSIENAFANCLQQYDYQEIRLPIVEQTSLFKRSIGEVTDIVEKEMYTFLDNNGDSLSLRPEGTAGCVRACLEHGLLYNQQQKLWYAGPMFRHEKPQKGRYRQFHQLGVEVFGIAGTNIELELILLSKRFLNQLGIDQHIELQINTLGTIEERKQYQLALVQWFQPHLHCLDPESRLRLERNPLRLLDSKNPEIQELIAQAPKLIDWIGTDSRQYFNELCDHLTALKIPFKINTLLVRGLDYYEHTVFEWVTDQLGSQGTICAGGRFDMLVEHLGGHPTFAVGFAMGVERLMLLMNANTTQSNLVYIIADSTNIRHALELAESLRDNSAKLFNVIVNTSGGSFKNQFKKADKSGANLALILGESEIQDHMVSIKDLRNSVPQQTIAQNTLQDFLAAYFA